MRTDSSSRGWVAFAVSLALASAGCGDDGGSGGNDGATSTKTNASTSTAGECVGGVIKDGVCEGKCKPELCIEGNICVDNRCVLPCEAHADCIPNEQLCAPAINDDTGEGVNVCTYTTKSKSIGIPCPASTECAASMACPDGTPCGPGVEAPTCEGDSCKPLICLTSGPGDADALCTNVDCQTDADCGGGMYCGIGRLAQLECGTMGADPNDCINAADFAKGGATIQRGPLGLLRNTCRPAGQCAPCASDLDCGLRPNQKCVNLSGELRCAAGCNFPSDCDDDHTCIGNFCVPKAGRCAGTGGFCEPCLNDLDCAAGGPKFACINTTGNQRACFDVDFPDACTKDSDCPQAASGRYGDCVDLDGNMTVDHCYLPMVSGKYMCWPANPLP